MGVAVASRGERRGAVSGASELSRMRSRMRDFSFSAAPAISSVAIVAVDERRGYWTTIVPLIAEPCTAQSYSYVPGVVKVRAYVPLPDLMVLLVKLVDPID